MQPSQSCKMAEGSSFSRTPSRTPRERAVSLLRVVQNFLEESNEVSVKGASNEPNHGSSMQHGVPVMWLPRSGPRKGWFNMNHATSTFSPPLSVLTRDGRP